MRLTAVDVLQTSAMDCGPAAVASLLASSGRPIDLSRLREACQTDLDGTSIDIMEQVLTDHGLPAKQRMVPADRLADHLPALVVVRLPDGAPHFVVVWRRIGPFVQVMDPARGGSWQRLSLFRARLLCHTHRVAAADWCAWAKGDENLSALRAKAQSLGLPPHEVDRAAEQSGWFALASLEACIALAASLPTAGDKARIVRALLQETRQSEDDIFRLVPASFWPVVPDPTLRRGEEPRLMLQGAVLLSVGRADPGTVAESHRFASPAAKPASLVAACRATGKGLPLLLLAGTVLAVLGSLFEALAFRHLIEPSMPILPDRPETALWVTLTVLVALFAMRLMLGVGLMRLGRQVERHYRMATMSKLLRLPDRWLASRPLGDMAERARSLPLMRTLPGQVMHLAQSLTEVLALTLCLILLAPANALAILALAALAIAWPALTAPLLREREMTLRSLGAAQATLLMDALRGQAAVIAHHAQAALVARQDGLLDDWNRSARDRMRLAATAGAIGQALILALTAGLALSRTTDLLFLWWLLKLPSAALDLSALLRGIPAQQAMLARLEEPLRAPDRPFTPLRKSFAQAASFGIALQGARVSAGGHVILHDLSLNIAAGEDVAIVGASGSGKSSLIGLLLGWHDLASGSMQVNGEPIGLAELAALRRRMVWLDPVSRLWGATLSDAAQRPDLLAKAGLDLSPETPTGAGGALLSAGEGQRLRLARAFGQGGTNQTDPGLVLCDEALRGLDAERRRGLLATIKGHWSGKTLIWVTHDATEAMGFSRVLVMRDGRLVQDGPPPALAKAAGPFASLLAAERKLALRLEQDWQPLAIGDFRVEPAS
ncbi:ATP-binding cassette domain-containing protein [Paragemmobacter straminiformis]|uniref:ATP-binding cassette domain-containing protein n=1 Tax=Paragemmobacter straminiformis TaxID=2045119 RepID=A0A842I6H7_9RHOB|nr:ATP-binding cassette domain-containing protein [Gemmobacter straminiformis]MBC2835013.1 ATP-binding cassette domain-containing protein [Gemmobacter straminiformis]